jgi:hypothetical protein
MFKIIKELVTQQVTFEPTRYVLATFVEQMQTLTTALFTYVLPPVRRKSPNSHRTNLCEILYLRYFYLFKVCKSVHHHTVQMNQPTRWNSFSGLLLDVYIQLNVFLASSRPSSGAQQLQ